MYVESIVIQTRFKKVY